MLRYLTNMCARSAQGFASPRPTALFLLLVLLTVPGPALVRAQSYVTCKRKLIQLDIFYRDCEPKSVLAMGCSGGCHSYTSPIPNNATHLERSCQCCRERGRVRHPVNLTCPYEPKPVEVWVSIPRLCFCRPCTDFD